MINPLYFFEAEVISFGSNSSIVDQNGNGIVFLFDKINKGINALGIGDVKFLEVDTGVGMFREDLSFRLLA